jgi:hypothetical protein
MNKAKGQTMYSHAFDVHGHCGYCDRHFSAASAVNCEKSSVNVLIENMDAFDRAKSTNCRFGIVNELAGIVKHNAATARERIIRYAIRSLDSAVPA